MGTTSQLNNRVWDYLLRTFNHVNNKMNHLPQPMRSSLGKYFNHFKENTPYCGQALVTPKDYAKSRSTILMEQSILGTTQKKKRKGRTCKYCKCFTQDSPDRIPGMDWCNGSMRGHECRHQSNRNFLTLNFSDKFRAF